MIEYVTVVDKNNNVIGKAEKMEAHQKAILHRAFSVFIFNDNMQMLIHQRALTKYHSGGKWTNACCGHPRPDEDIKQAAQRRLSEEMGITCELNEQFVFSYYASLDHDLTENEIDHVFFGKYNHNPVPNPDEVMDYKWISISELQHDLANNKEHYTAWFNICIDRVLTGIENYIS